jgi:predicted transposase YdaD
MKESTTYQAILREGRIEGEQRMLLIQGDVRFGTPDERIREAIEAIRDLEQLERLSRQLLDPTVNDWAELLDTP